MIDPDVLDHQHGLDGWSHGEPNFATFAMNKAAAPNLTQSLAVELGPRDVRVDAGRAERIRDAR